VERAAAVEVNQRFAFSDRVGHRLDPVDAVNDAVEAFGAVGPFVHAISGPGLCGRAAR
jgi:hypothetical protein